LDIARAIRDGDLPSPQRFGNLLLIAIRVTGTGCAYRRALDEFVFRSPALYLNDEFLERCNGLPVLWEHPKDIVLDSREFAKRIIGTIALPYVRGTEVWAVAKIYDDDAASALCNTKLSTSPAVVFSGLGEGNRRPMVNGATILIEGKPSLLDHVCITPLGVWDRGAEPCGVARGTLEQIMHKLEAQA
jgi:hypothetical protein